MTDVLDVGDRVVVHVAGSVYDGLVGSVVEAQQWALSARRHVKVEFDAPPPGWQPIKPWFSVTEVARADD